MTPSKAPTKPHNESHMKTETKTKPTSTPWAVESNVMAGGVNHLAITARHERVNWMPCSITPMRLARPIDEANAALIVRAVNCHEDLLAALQLILPMAHGYARNNPVGNNAAFIEQARAAIAKATP